MINKRVSATRVDNNKTIALCGENLFEKFTTDMVELLNSFSICYYYYYLFEFIIFHCCLDIKLI